MNKANPYESPRAQDSAPENKTNITAEARFVFTQEHFLETLDNLRSQNKLRKVLLRVRYLPAIFLLFSACVAVLSPISANSPSFWSIFHAWSIASLLIALAALCLFIRQVNVFFAKRQFQKSPFKNIEYTICLSDEGFAAKSLIDESLIKWSLISSVIVFPDGLLLCRPGNMANWLPEEAFFEEDYSKAIELLSCKFRLIHSI